MSSRHTSRDKRMFSITGDRRKPIVNFANETACSHVESLDRKLQNVHRRMAGKLCGPSSSKASPASTPIPLDTAKHKILKSNDTREKETRYTRNTHIYKRIAVHTPNTHTHTHTYTPPTEISRAKKCPPSCKSIHSQANRNEGMSRRGKKRVKMRKHQKRDRKREKMGWNAKDEKIWKSCDDERFNGASKVKSCLSLLSLPAPPLYSLLARVEVDGFAYSSVVTLKSA